MARRPPLSDFVGQDTYRLRRWRDAARLLPVLGLVLWLVPLLWPPGETSNGAILIYLFVVWLLLIVAAAVIARRAQPDAQVEPPEAD